jgi:ABC-type multidrug transport system fused ATPase/permease subunit
MVHTHPDPGLTMRSLPVEDPGTPDHRSPMRYLWWMTRVQARTMIGGIVFGVISMVGQALMPATIGRAIDEGVTAKNLDALLAWSGALLVLGVVQAAAGIMRHRFVVFAWLGGAFRTIQVTTRQATRLGAGLSERLATGEVVSIGIADVAQIGNAMEITGRGAGSIAAIVVVGAILLVTSEPLGLIVLIGVPLMAVLVGPLLRPLHHHQNRQRDLTGLLTTRSNDIVSGLRVLRGIGGEDVVSGRYHEESQSVRHAGVRVARTESMLEGAQVLLPGLLVALVTWIGARFALSGKITPGQLVSFYGYAVFLISPLRTLTEAADKITKAHVAAKRVVRVLSIAPAFSNDGSTTKPTNPTILYDSDSSFTASTGRFTAIAAALPEDAKDIADRLSRFTEGDVTWGGVQLRDYPLATVRRGILLADNDARLFSGRLRDELDPGGQAGEDDLASALDAACADDIVESLPNGLDSPVEEGGREFSGGQNQRLRLARALVADAEVLILIEPTSAVDAHTEARIADRLGKARGDRTTIVCTTSPLVLDRADEVAYVENGQVVAVSSHQDLLANHPRYRATVTREEA